MQINIEAVDVPRTSAAIRGPLPIAYAHGEMRDLLKRSTQSLHVDAERALDLPARTRDIPSYREMLARFHGFHAPLEDALSRAMDFETTGLQFGPRRKLGLLHEDLISLGMDPAEIAALQSCHDLPRIDTSSDALGCLYVLEGSTLGGQFISRHLKKSLGLARGNGATFFSSYGDRVPQMWADFCLALEAHAQWFPNRRGSMVVAAQSTFRKLSSWIASARA